MTCGVKAALRAGIVAIPLAGLSACGGSGGVNTTPTPIAAPSPTPTPAPTPTPTPTPTINYNTAEYQRSNAASQANAITAYDSGSTGAGVVVGVVDSGVAPSLSEFSGRIHSASADVAGSRGVSDEDGHGTAVAAVLLAAKNDSNTHGVAFGATLLSARADTPGSCATTTGTDPGCSFNDNAIARGIDLAVVNGARVINVSLGGSPANLNLQNAIYRAANAGTVIVISAGNDGVTDPVAAVNPDPLAQIAIDPRVAGLVLIAGAVDSTHQLADFSNKAGNSANFYLTALGVRVRTIDQTGTAFLYSGTSFSAPVVSGAVALLAQAFPNLTGRQIVDLLLRTATDLGVSGIDSTYGRGELNIAAAFAPQGTTALAGSKIPVSLTQANGSLSAPMGDAAGQSLGAVVLDGLGRAYTVDLGNTFNFAPQRSTLGASLKSSARAFALQSGILNVQVSLAQSDSQPVVSSLSISNSDRRKANSLAGSIITQLGHDQKLALGISKSSGALISALDLRRAAAFVASSAVGDDWGIGQSPHASFALEQTLGMIKLTASAEQGAIERIDRLPIGASRAGRNDQSYQSLGVGLTGRAGPLRLGGQLVLLDEARTILGARIGMLGGSVGARSGFLDAKAGLDFGPNWSFSTAYRTGWTWARRGGLSAGSGQLRSDSWSVDLSRYSLITRDDILSVRVSQPLRVLGGGVDLRLPTSYDYQTETVGYDIQRLALSPTGRERDAELVWQTPVSGGTLIANLYARHEPGNIRANTADLGAAIRLSLGF